MFLVGLGLFYGLHFLPSTLPEVRAQLVSKFGDRIYRGVFSLLVFVAFVLMFTGYRRMDTYELWVPPVWASYLAFAIMPGVFVLWVAAELNGRIREKIKHPAIIGVLLWASVHLANNGDRKSLYLFGSFALYSVFSIISLNRRCDRPKSTAGMKSYDATAVITGIIFFTAMLFWGHGILFGVTPTLR